MHAVSKHGSGARRRAHARRLTLALLPALAAGRLAADCTPAPPRPAGAAVSADEWKAAVHPNCFDNGLRLARWTGKDARIVPKQSPAQYFATVGANSITGGTVVVLVHGWAPGFRTAVDKAGGNLRWWGDGAVDSSGEWTSDWAWVPTTGTSYPFTVTDSGVFQELYAHDPGSTVLGYSWLDDSATLQTSWTDLTYVYRSEAYTNVNGLRLADALDQVLAQSFWSGPGNRLHLIGHSHGSKVATVATLALQSRGRRVDHLTILDTPESDLPLEGNGANLLGYYLDQIITRIGSAPATAGTFVDNYISLFGVAFTGSANAEKVVEVVLDPEVYSCDPLSDSYPDRHSYAATWYAGAAAAAASFKLPPIGFDWPPPPSSKQPAFNQEWSGGISARSQWPLTPGQAGSIGCLSSAETCAYSARPTAVALGKTTGNVSGTPASGLVFTAKSTAESGSGVVNSSASLQTNYSGSQYGIAFQVEWTAPAAGDYLVVTGDTDEGEGVLLVMDGKSAIAGRNPVSINAYVGFYLPFAVYYLPAAINTAGQVTLSDFRRIEIGGEDCTELPVAPRPAAAE